MDVGQLKGIAPRIPEPTRESTASGSAQAPSFGEALERAIGTVEANTQAADSSAISYIGGEDDDLHNVMMAMERADLSFRTMLQVRNKLLDAYREIMRMQV